MFTYTTTVRFHDTDAAGIIYFANVLRIAHTAYESFLESIGSDVGKINGHSTYFFPLVHCEADYTKPMKLGDRLQVRVSLSHLGNTSFALSYQFSNQTEAIMATAKTIHVAVNRASFTSAPLPSDLITALNKL